MWFIFSTKFVVFCFVDHAVWLKIECKICRFSHQLDKDDIHIHQEQSWRTSADRFVWDTSPGTKRGLPSQKSQTMDALILFYLRRFAGNIAGKLGNAYLRYHNHQSATRFPLTATLAMLVIPVLPNLDGKRPKLTQTQFVYMLIVNFAFASTHWIPNLQYMT